MPAQSTLGQLLHLTGSGFAAGAPITIGYYPGAKVLTHTLAGPTGTFAVDIRTSVLGSHTFVAAGVGSNGQTRYLEATYPDAELEVAEIDPGVTRTAGEMLGLGPGTRVVTYNTDAREVVEAKQGAAPYDLVFGDAVSLGGFIPVTLLVVALLASRGAVRRLLYDAPPAD